MMVFVSDVLAQEYKEEFLGMQVLDSEKVEEAFSVFKDEKSEVYYSFYPTLANDKIIAYGKWGENELIKWYSIRFEIINNSEIPIQMNNVFDEYGLITKDDTSYILEIRDEKMDYPSTKFINPGQSRYIVVNKPPRLELDDIKYLTIHLVLSEVKIVLKKID
ncbi:hypothetical protein ACFL6H_06995 [Candidatus Latescibacterota bacterium]